MAWKACRTSWSTSSSVPSNRTASSEADDRSRLGAGEVVVEPGLRVLVPGPWLAQRGVRPPEGAVGVAVGEGHLESRQRGTEDAGEHVVRSHPRREREGHPTVDEHDVRPPIAMPGGRGRGDVRTHGVTGQRGLFEAEVVEHGKEILGMRAHSERRRQLAGEPAAAEVGCHQRDVGAERPRHPLPRAVVAGDPVGCDHDVLAVAPPPDVQGSARDRHVEARVGSQHHPRRP